METALRQTIKTKGFKVQYQPIISVYNKIIALETLARWQYKSNWISPSKFLPFIEKMGLMRELSLQIVEQSAKDWQIWKKRIPEISHIAINLSPSVFHYESADKFFEQLIQILHKYKLSPQEVCLEFTENVLLQQKSIPLMDHLKESGFLLALDDFGTGYSSLAYLASFNFDIIKLDKIMVEKIEFNLKQREVIQAIVQLANRLNMKVIAEGIENKEQLNILANMGIYGMQGFYLSRPKFIGDWKRTEVIQI